MEKNSFSIRPFWYKSKDLERIKDVYRGTTVFRECFVKNNKGHSNIGGLRLTLYKLPNAEIVN
jgi:hypothetical protein